jgi:hypothetical protein
LQTQRWRARRASARGGLIAHGWWSDPAVTLADVVVAFGARQAAWQGRMPAQLPSRGAPQPGQVQHIQPTHGRTELGVQGDGGLRHIINATRYSWAGLRAAVRHEASFRQETAGRRTDAAGGALACGGAGGGFAHGRQRVAAVGWSSCSTPRSSRWPMR